MKLPIPHPGNDRGASSTMLSLSSGVQPLQLNCSLGPCQQGKRLHICRKRICTFYQTGHIICNWQITHIHWHPCGIVPPHLPFEALPMHEGD
ncbi:MAG: hypothetical protein HY842_07930 [Bacteroidetes bacterium]|nr:hypothetical protein [Bacteroidota bacterium]